MGSDLMQDIRGNTRGRDKDGKRKIDINDMRALPKKKISKKTTLIVKATRICLFKMFYRYLRILLIN